MKLLFRQCLAFPLFLCASMVAAGASADVVVVVSARSGVTSLSAGQITKIFLDKTDTLPNGEKAVPIDQAEGSQIRDEFYSKVLNKNSSRISAYWAKVIFAGKGHPPKQMEGNVSVRRAVADNPNAIGYIDRSTVDSSVRIVLDP